MPSSIDELIAGPSLFTNLSRNSLSSDKDRRRTKRLSLHVELHNVCRSRVGDDKITTRHLNWPEGMREYTYNMQPAAHMHMRTCIVSSSRETLYQTNDVVCTANHSKRRNERFRNQLWCIIFVRRKSESRWYYDSENAEFLEECK